MILVAMQYYPGDYREAMDAAKLFAELLEGQCQHDFVFFRRHDAPEPDKHTFAVVQQKFRKTMSEAGKGRYKGWPDGCNGLWHELMFWSLYKKRNNSMPWDAVLTVESDTVPTTHKYLELLDQAYMRADKNIIGCNVEGSHINGNLMISPETLMEYRELTGTPSGVSWDWFHKDLIMRISEHTHLIQSEHRCKSMNEKKLYSTPCVLFHGVKDDTARKIVRRKYGIHHTYEPVKTTSVPTVAPRIG